MTTHTAMPNHKVPKGRPDSFGIKRFREMLGIQQDALAFDLSLSQQAVSLLEQKEIIDAALLQQISAVLKIPAEAIQNFDEQHTINIIAQTVNNHDQSASVFYNSTINPVDQLIKVHEEKIALYERRLKEKDEMMSRLERLIGEIKIKFDLWI